jgi:hypothetical protein
MTSKYSRGVGWSEGCAVRGSEDERRGLNLCVVPSPSRTVSFSISEDE